MFIYLHNAERQYFFVIELFENNQVHVDMILDRYKKIVDVSPGLEFCNDRSAMNDMKIVFCSEMPVENDEGTEVIGEITLVIYLHPEMAATL